MILIIIVTLIIAFWVFSGWLAYGAWLAYFQRKWPTLAYEDRDNDRRGARFAAITGPICLFSGIFMFNCFRYGFMWRIRE